MFIQFEDTPNPSTIKFLPGQTVLKSGTRDYNAKEEAAASPLAMMLFDLEHVDGVFLALDYISVTKTDDIDWELLKPRVMAKIMEHFTTGQPAVTDQTEDNHDEPLDEISTQIKALLDERVKPAVAMDGGNIEFVRFEEGVAYLRLEGACSGCPSSTVTLKHGIENMLKHYVPEVETVEAING